MTTPADDLALRNLMATYVDAVNRSDADAWAATWAADGEWNLLGNPVHGRDNIVGLWLQMMGSFEFAIMMPSSAKFEVNGDTATGHWYLQEFTRDKEGNAGTILSRYVDTYTKHNGEWLYQTRTYTFFYNGPADLSGEYTPIS